MRLRRGRTFHRANHAVRLRRSGGGQWLINFLPAVLAASRSPYCRVLTLVTKVQGLTCMHTGDDPDLIARESRPVCGKGVLVSSFGPQHLENTLTPCELYNPQKMGPGGYSRCKFKRLFFNDILKICLGRI
jgi:hypothetical protein